MDEKFIDDIFDYAKQVAVAQIDAARDFAKKRYGAQIKSQKNEEKNICGHLFCPPACPLCPPACPPQPDYLSDDTSELAETCGGQDSEFLFPDTQEGVIVFRDKKSEFTKQTYNAIRLLAGSQNGTVPIKQFCVEVFGRESPTIDQLKKGLYRINQSLQDALFPIKIGRQNAFIAIYY